MTGHMRCEWTVPPCVPWDTTQYEKVKFLSPESLSSSQGEKYMREENEWVDIISTQKVAHKNKMDYLNKGNKDWRKILWFICDTMDLENQ